MKPKGESASGKTISDQSKVVLPLWFLSVTCYACMYMEQYGQLNSIGVGDFRGDGRVFLAKEI